MGRGGGFTVPHKMSVLRYKKKKAVPVVIVNQFGSMLRHICNLKPGRFLFFFKVPPFFLFCPLPFFQWLWFGKSVQPVLRSTSLDFGKTGCPHIDHPTCRGTGEGGSVLPRSASFHLVNQLTKNIPWKTASWFLSLLHAPPPCIPHTRHTHTYTHTYTFITHPPPLLFWVLGVLHPHWTLFVARQDDLTVHILICTWYMQVLWFMVLHTLF